MLKFQRVTVLALAATVAWSTLMADTVPAVLYGTPTATVNGASARRAQTVFQGDAIKTAESAATIVAKGTMIQLGAHSSLKYGNDVLQFQDGAALVTTKAGVKTVFSGMTIRPVQNGRYLVSNSNGKVQIAALNGRIEVAAGPEMRLIEEGSAMTIPGDAAAAWPQGPQGENPLKKASVGLIIAGGLAAVIVAYMLSQQHSNDIPISPTLP